DSAWQLAEISSAITPVAKGGELDGVVAVEETSSVVSIARIAGLEMYLAGIGTAEPVDVSDPRAIEKAREALTKKHDVGPKSREHIRRDRDRLERAREGEKEYGQPHVDSADQLKDLVGKGKEEGRLPTVVAVQPGNSPFWSDSGAETAGGSGGRHVVTITDY